MYNYKKKIDILIIKIFKIIISAYYYYNYYYNYISYSFSYSI